MDRISKDDHAICTTEYSRIVPLENGEVSHRMLSSLWAPGVSVAGNKKIKIKLKKSRLEDWAFKQTEESPRRQWAVLPYIRAWVDCGCATRLMEAVFLCLFPFILMFMWGTCPQHS